LESPQLIRVDENLSDSLSILIEDTVLTSTTSSPKLTAKIVNDSFYDLSDLDVIAILYDKEGNALAAGKTRVDPLRKNTSENLFFTWPKPFEETVITTEIIPRIDVFSVTF